MEAGRPSPVVETIDLNGTTVCYVVRRNPRAKYMRITISPYYGVVVTLPARLRRYVNPEELLREKQDWVLEQLKRIPVSTAPQPLRNGTGVYFLGREYPVRIKRGDPRPGCALEHDHLMVRLPLEFAGDPKQVVVAWIKERAKERICAEAERLAEQIDVRYVRLSVRDQKTKWGSCSKNGAISFNWRLILFPVRIMRYVVIHELCHLRHFNHSARFWALVEKHDPRFEESVAWLKENGMRLEASLR